MDVYQLRRYALMSLVAVLLLLVGVVIGVVFAVRGCAPPTNLTPDQRTDSAQGVRP